MSVVLSEHLPLLVSAPDGIQKLRGLILELAVRGKLVPQDPTEGQSHWRHGSFGEFFSLEYGDNLPAPKRSESGEYPVYGSNGIVGTHNECRVNEPCIVVGRKGSAGALNRCRQNGCWVTDVAYYCVPPTGIDLDYAFTLFHTLGLNELGKGIKPGLSRSEAYVIPVAIPPLAEQHHIVAKVDELMALCDRLEQEVGAGETAHTKLVEILLGTLTQSPDAADLAANWQRLAEHFNTLFTTEASIDALKQTVLQLAVMGKLVPQDPNDEPVPNRRAKIQLGQNLPANWEIQPLSEIATEIVDCPHSTPKWTNAGMVCVRTSQFKPGFLDLSNPRYVSEATYLERIQRLQPKESDILYSREGGILGVACRVPPNSKLCLGQRMMLIRSGSRCDSKFLEYLLNSPLITTIAREMTLGGAAPRVNVATVKAYPIPLPPLAEQHRIVGKVDELMALCDRLKADLAESRTRQARLSATLIESALQAA